MGGGRGRGTYQRPNAGARERAAAQSPDNGDMVAKLRAWAFAAIAGASAAAFAQDPGHAGDVIGGMKRFEEAQGIEPTGNFERRSEKAAASYRCYFTGKLELPETYDQLQLRQTKGQPCPIDETRYDVFYYAIEAVASGNTPVTGNLEKASIERVLMVVPHEDLHDAKELKGLPAAIAEAATTLIGFHTAAAFARERYGAESNTYRNLSREAELFLRKSEIVNRYFENLKDLYAGVREGRTTRESALSAKAETFSRLREECQAIRPAPSSFDACPAALNNAGLAFDSTYTRYYPLIYRVYVASGRDFQATLNALGPRARGKAKSEAEVAAYLRSLSGE
jgi:hypothetical protein